MRAVVLEEGAQVTEAGQGPSLGHVTSSYHSAALGRGFALALVAGGRSRIGSRLRVPMPSGVVEAVVTDPVFVPRPAERPFAPPPPPLPLLPAVVRSAPVARPARSVRLAALAPATLLSVRAGPGAATAIGMAIGVLLPTVPCRSVIARERAALWLGPDEWLIQAPEGSTGLEALARRAPGDRPASVVDVSQRFRALEIAGPSGGLVPERVLRPGPRSARVSSGHVHADPAGQGRGSCCGASAPEVFHIDVPRSLLPYVWACLEEARLEFADEATDGG